MDAFKLCYIKGAKAYFTTTSQEKQWGDDWNDAPYEHNAGEPYEWMPGIAAHPKPYNLKAVYFDGTPYQTPDYTHLNSPYSVQQINRGDAPWLRDSYGNNPPIPAGTLYGQFINMIHRAGGQVFEPINKDVPRCRVCACTDDIGCMDGCWWIESDLCSSCGESKIDG
jgi:hypothetical protein